jgi:hypothetical protein
MNMKILIIAILLSPIYVIGQINRYVSPAGNNFNTGTLALPWLTIQHGLNQLTTNDTLNVLTGTYTEKVTIPLSNIYLRNYLSNIPVIDATGITSQNSIISINNKSNITVRGFELKNNIQNDAQGILITGSGSDLTIKNCNIHDIHFSSNTGASINANTNAQGIIVYGTNATTAITNLKIQNNQLYNCRLGFSEGIAVNGNVDGFEVTENTVYSLTNIGVDLIGHEGTCNNPANDQARNGLVKNNTIHHCISPYATSGGIYIDGGKAIIVENNTSYHNGYGIEVGCENIGKTTDGITIRNNIFYDNQICAVALGGYDYPSGSGKVINSTIKNNTCYYNDYSNSGNGELYLSYSENSAVENNIFYTNTQNTLAYAELTQPSLSFNYNTIYALAGTGSLVNSWNGAMYTGYSAFVIGSSTNANSVFNNPLFVTANISTPNFHLLSGSPSINAGNPSFIPSITEVDIDAELRANGIVDCGADEYYDKTTSTEILETAINNQYSVYPNPCTDFVDIKSNTINTEIKIYNAFGQVVLKTLIDTENQINIKYLPNGVYFIRFNNDTKQVLKLIKE